MQNHTEYLLMRAKPDLGRISSVADIILKAIYRAADFSIMLVEMCHYNLFLILIFFVVVFIFFWRLLKFSEPLCSRHT